MLLEPQFGASDSFLQGNQESQGFGPQTLSMTVRKERAFKYGSLSKGFTEQEAQLFFRGIDNDKFRLLFPQLGLRVGEAVKVHYDMASFLVI